MFKQKAILAGITLALSCALPAAHAADKPLKSIGITVGSLGNPYFVTIAKGFGWQARSISAKSDLRGEE